MQPDGRERVFPTPQQALVTLLYSSRPWRYVIAPPYVRFHTSLCRSQRLSMRHHIRLTLEKYVSSFESSEGLTLQSADCSAHTLLARLSARPRASWPVQQLFNRWQPTARWPNISFLHLPQQRVFNSPSPAPTASLTPKLLQCSLALQDWCFPFITQRADISWI